MRTRKLTCKGQRFTSCPVGIRLVANSAVVRCKSVEVHQNPSAFRVVKLLIHRQGLLHRSDCIWIVPKIKLDSRQRIQEHAHPLVRRGTGFAAAHCGG